MPAPIENTLRVEIVQRHKEGESLRSISEELQLSYDTVKKIWQHWRKYGRIEPNYEKAKQRGTRQYQDVHEAAISMKKAHPRWGAKLILLELRKTQTAEKYPSERTLQRWFQQAGITRPVAERKKRDQSVKRGREVHAVWAVDAKERMTLGDQSGASWLVVSDEASGAVLHTEAFPPQALDPGNDLGGTE